MKEKKHCSEQSRTVRRICSSGAIAKSGSRKSESRASVAAMTLRNWIGDPGLRADKKERARLGIPDEAWVRHHPPIFGTNLRSEGEQVGSDKHAVTHRISLCVHYN